MRSITICLLLLLAFNIFATDISSGYKNIKLGMQYKEVMDIIKKSPEFYSGREEAISVRIDPDTEIISAEGIGLVKMAYFHFNKDSLFQIFLKIDESKVGYYKLLKKFNNKYGNPNFLEPKRAYWEDSDVRIIIEKPCTLKYQLLSIWAELTKDTDPPTNNLNKYIEKFIEDL